ncbi:MAG: hypothetical protein ACTSRI_11315 [Promethearchaeota archaeon]
MSISEKKQFLLNFQKKIIQGRKLLARANHKWGAKLFNNLYYQIQKTEWIDAQKKHQLIMIISNSWWMYLNSLIRHKEDSFYIDIIKYIDGYKRFFSFLSKLDDFYLFNNFALNLLRTFIEIPVEELSITGITKFINSFSAEINSRGDSLKLIELQILLMYLRKSVIPSEFFRLSMKKLGRIIFKLEPSKRPLFLLIFLENVNIKFQLMNDSTEFVKITNKILINRLPSYLKNEFTNLSRISINQRNFNSILIDLEELIFYLNNIGEHTWIIIIIRNIFSRIQEYNSFGDAITYIRRFIDFSINRNRFEIVFEIYDFIEDLFMGKTDLGYDNILIELWVDACKKFVDMKEKKYLLQSLEKLNNHLKIPQTNEQIFHFFYTCNYLWQFKSIFFSLEPKDFWRMMFYRALFEEKDFNTALKIIPFLDNDLRAILTDLNLLYNEAESFKTQIYSFKETNINSQLKNIDFTIQKLILRINSEGEISYWIKSFDKTVIEGKIINEFWNDNQITEIYNDIFSDKKEKIYNFNLTEFGKLLYAFQPKLIRDLYKKFKIINMDNIPQIYFILDNMTIPFELLFDNNFFMLKYTIGYKIGEPPLSGMTLEHIDQDEIEPSQVLPEYDVLIIESINAMCPLKWNEEEKKKELIFPFLAGEKELEFMTTFFNNRKEISQINILSGPNSTRENILTKLSQKGHHLINFVGNIFYSKASPKDSYFLTNDNQIVKFNEIFKVLSQNHAQIHPFLFFNTQIYDIEGKKIKNTLRIFGEIVAQFDYTNITGVIFRNYPIFNEDTKEIMANFYVNFFKHMSQGEALLKARQQCMAKKAVNLAEHQIQSMESDEGIFNISIESNLAISSFVLFGKPEKKLKKINNKNNLNNNKIKIFE